MADYSERIARELKLPVSGVQAVSELLAEGCTVPFIARYRKEKTGSLDEVAITSIRDGLTRVEDLEKRRASILSSLTERKLLTAKLKESIEAAASMTALEDLYFPYRQKRRTRGLAAREAGLEPLAAVLMKQENCDVAAEAAKYINKEKKINTVDDALAGARDIIAEDINENLKIRQMMRRFFVINGVCSSRLSDKNKDKDGNVKNNEALKYQSYFSWSSSFFGVPSHQLLAVLRGEKEGFLTVSIRPDDTLAINRLHRELLKDNDNDDSEQVRLAIIDGYKRLLAPSMETEARNTLKKLADDTAIKIFAHNLRDLLMAAPFGARPVLAIDPGIRTGCKVVCLDATGNLLEHTVIFIHRSKDEYTRACQIIRDLVAKHHPEAIAYGNGTASRETEDFLRGLNLGIPSIVVNESGASVYSASKIAREEFPDQDVTVRGAVSIGRRLMDPLAELVKIDPKSIGVGQYQHDVDQKELKNALDDTVISCVNSVGVDLNTSSAKLLSYVSGLTPSLANNIVKYREENGPFTLRKQALNVPRLGPKTYQQCAGFLRVRASENPLDNSAVHPENYNIVDAIAKDLGCNVAELVNRNDLREKIDLTRYVTNEIGLPTLEDILTELEKPGRDPRSKFEVFSFAHDVRTISDLKPGMKLPGIVTNVTAFGAFINIGVHEDGLLHVSHIGSTRRMADMFHPGTTLEVIVEHVDVSRNRIGLTWDKAPKGHKRKKNRKKK